METNSTTNKLLLVIAILMYCYFKAMIINVGRDPEVDMKNISILLENARKEVMNGN